MKTRKHKLRFTGPSSKSVGSVGDHGCGEDSVDENSNRGLPQAHTRPTSHNNYGSVGHKPLGSIPRVCEFGALWEQSFHLNTRQTWNGLPFSVVYVTGFLAWIIDGRPRQLDNFHSSEDGKT